MTAINFAYIRMSHCTGTDVSSKVKVGSCSALSCGMWPCVFVLIMVRRDPAPAR